MLLGVALVSPNCAESCETRALLGLRIADGFPVVLAEIGSVLVSVIVDTGSEGNLLTAEAARRLDLPRGMQTVIRGTGGDRVVETAVVKDWRLGRLTLPEETDPLQDVPGLPAVRPPVAGLIGLQALAAFDVDLDFVSGQMALADPCTPAPRMILPIGPDGSVPVQINGIILRGLLDTGSRGTLLTLEAARRLGLNAPIAASTARGIDGNSRPLRYVTLDRLSIGPDTETQMKASVSDFSFGAIEVLIGMDFLQHRRVWIAAGHTQLGFLPPAGRD